MTVKERDEDGEETGEARTLFRAVAVFDVSQTDPLPDRDPVPLEPPREPITGSSHAHVLTPLENLAAELGYTVRRLPLDGEADGWCDFERQEIVVDEKLAANAQVRVLVHELAHALGLGYRDFGRERAEVLVDTVTYVVCGSAGLDVSGESIPYVAGWGEEGRSRRSASTRRRSTRSPAASRGRSRPTAKTPPTPTSPRRSRRRSATPGGASPGASLARPSEHAAPWVAARSGGPTSRRLANDELTVGPRLP